MPIAIDSSAEMRSTAAEAAVEAARLRLRPILMTSIAFLLGVLPLALATGAGAGAQNAIGIGVLGGGLLQFGLGDLFADLLVLLLSVAIIRSPRLRGLLLRSATIVILVYTYFLHDQRPWQTVTYPTPLACRSSRVRG